MTAFCTHIKTDGTRCGSPAVKGTSLCFHHSAVKTALGKVKPLDQIAYGAFTPIPFVFPEDRAAMQINYFLLLQAINEQRVERRAADLMLRMLRSMDKNLGKAGSLVPAQTGEEAVSEGVGSEETASGGARDGESADAGQSEAAVGQMISEVNAVAAAVGYRDYRAANSLHPAGQRVLNLYCKPRE